MLIFLIFCLTLASSMKPPMNPEEIGGDIEGDILLTNSDKSPRSGILSKRYRWPDSTIPYTFASNHFTSSQITLMKSAMAEISKWTCIKFVPRTSQKDYIVIQNGNGCSSYVGRIGGPQQVNLMHSPGRGSCLVKGIIMHELIHSIGYTHMHSSHDRNNYVKILYNNVVPGAEINFRIRSSKEMDNFGTPYDYESIMHYARTAFSGNGQPTIETKNSYYTTRIGQRSGMTSGDILRIKRMYNCH